jgi:4-methylaminobutanoate oxidase (formaldehyde-forming)
MPRATQVIVGAGILGCALARELAQRVADPKDILVVDPNPLASQATVRAAALISLARPWRRTHWVPLVQRTLAAIEDLRAEGFEVPMHRCGALHVAASDAARATLADHQATAALHGVDSLVEAPVYFADRLPWLACSAFAQGLWFPDEAYTDPYLLASAYAASARHRGVRFQWGSAARIDANADGERVRVRVGDDAWVPERVWVAAGAWTNALLAPLGCAVPYAPVRSRYWITEPSPLAPENMPMVLAPDLRLYSRPELGSILFGLRESRGATADPRELPVDLAGFAFGVDDGFAALEARFELLQRYAPRLLELGLRHHIAGPSGYSPDGEFAVGRIAPWTNLMVLGACNGAGIAVSAGLARVAANLAEGGADTDLAGRFAPDRFGIFDPWSAQWAERCIAARAAKCSG